MSNALYPHGTDPALRALQGLQRTLPRVDALEQSLSKLATAVAEGRREDVNRIADKLERFEGRLNQRLDKIEAVQLLAREEQKDICDKGQQDHAAMKAESADLRRQVGSIQRHLSVKRAREEGRTEAFSFVFKGVELLSDNWGKALTVAASVSALALAAWPPARDAEADPVEQTQAHYPPSATADIPPVSIRQPAPAQGHAEDWELRTTTDAWND